MVSKLRQQKTLHPLSSNLYLFSLRHSPNLGDAPFTSQESLTGWVPTLALAIFLSLYLSLLGQINEADIRWCFLGPLHPCICVRHLGLQRQTELFTIWVICIWKCVGADQSHFSGDRKWHDKCCRDVSDMVRHVVHFRVASACPQYFRMR